MNPFVPGPETAKARLFVFVVSGGFQPGLTAAATTRVRRISPRDRDNWIREPPETFDDAIVGVDEQFDNRNEPRIPKK